jgi:orotate phosphoribosyltransferase
LKPAMMSPEGCNVLSALILARLEPLNVDYVGGLVMGAVPLIGPVVQLSYLKGKPLPGFFVREQAKTHGTMKLVEGFVTQAELKGKNVAILDDVTTTGGSAMIAVNESKAMGAKVVMVLSVVDREEGAREFYRERNIKFDALFSARDFLKS